MAPPIRRIGIDSPVLPRTRRGICGGPCCAGAASAGAPGSARPPRSAPPAASPVPKRSRLVIPPFFLRFDSLTALPSCVLRSLKEQGSLIRARPADRRHVDRGIVHDRALALADAAADAELRPHVRLLQDDLLTVPARDRLLVRADRLRRDGADLLAHDARRLHRPRQAAPLVEERGAEADRALVAVGAEAELPLERRLLDRAGRADLGAERAVELAEADREVHHGRPEALEARLRQRRRLEDVRRADVDALVALDAPLEELRFRDGAGRPDRLRVEAALVDGLREAEERERQDADDAREDPD